MREFNSLQSSVHCAVKSPGGAMQLWYKITNCCDRAAICATLSQLLSETTNEMMQVFVNIVDVEILSWLYM